MGYKGPCTHVAYTWALKYLNRDYSKDIYIYIYIIVVHGLLGLGITEAIGVVRSRWRVSRLSAGRIENDNDMCLQYD